MRAPKAERRRSHRQHHDVSWPEDSCCARQNSHLKGIEVSDGEFAALKVKPSRARGLWNYAIRPKH